MRLSSFNIKHLAKMIAGDTEGWPYRGGPKLVQFFNEYGFRDVYETGFPTRYVFVEEKLRGLNGKEILRQVFTDLLDTRNWLSSQPGLKPVAICAEEVNNLLKFDKLEVVQDGFLYKVRDTSGSLVEVEAPFKSLSSMSEVAIDEQIRKCREKIAAEDFGGAITNARSLVETLLNSIEAELGTVANEPDGDLVRSFNRVRVLLNLDPSRRDVSDALKQVLTGLTSIVNGLAAMRNKMSDAHATTYKPAKHHAKLAVNAAKTVADFLFETVAYQKAKGHIQPKMAESKG